MTSTNAMPSKANNTLSQDKTAANPAAQAGGRAFPSTRMTMLLALQSEDAGTRRLALDVFLRVYRQPIYHYVRQHWHYEHEDAEDLTQNYLTRVLERDILDGYDPARARFRTYVRMCLDREILKQREAAGRIKRGGTAQHIPIDAAPEKSGHDPDKVFEREWTRSLFSEALERTRHYYGKNDKVQRFDVFVQHDIDPPADSSPSYSELAQYAGVSVTTITNWLAAARRAFRRELLDSLREICADEQDFLEEKHRLLAGTQHY